MKGACLEKRRRKAWAMEWLLPPPHPSVSTMNLDRETSFFFVVVVTCNLFAFTTLACNTSVD
ncbi:unnamed protein product [Prunus brigantina]